MEPIALIVGLGNPGSEYENTRHNAGFRLADSLCAAHGGRFTHNRRLRADIADIDIAGKRIRVLKPQTWMNLSGESVGAALRFFKLAPETMLVAYDEIDFPPGRLRLKFDGGHAGHNGIRNVIAHVGSRFWRLRIGVGHPGDRSKVKNHVLKRASSEDERTIEAGIERGAGVIPALLSDGPQRAQQVLHTETEGGEIDSGN